MRYVALLRAVNVGGAKLPMAQLRETCAGLGWENVRTYIQSGNVVFDSDRDAAALEAELEEAVAARFGFRRPVIVRSAQQWAVYAAGSPFPDAERAEPNRLMLGVAKAPPRPDAATIIEKRGVVGERVRLADDALWLYYPGGAGTTKLTPSAIDKAAGSPVTQRNWRTVVTIDGMLRD